jgi:hypothetical protein
LQEPSSSSFSSGRRQEPSWQATANQVAVAVLAVSLAAAVAAVAAAVVAPAAAAAVAVMKADRWRKRFREYRARTTR